MKNLILTVLVLGILIFVGTMTATPTTSATIVATAVAPTPWMPPNPYQDGKTPEDVDDDGYPICPPCQSPKKLNAACAAGCRATYAGQMAGLEQFCHDSYAAISSDMDDAMDHLGEITPACIQDCGADQGCVDACWANNQSTSTELMDVHMQQAAALDAFYHQQWQAYSAAYCQCLQSCCYHVTPPPY